MTPHFFTKIHIQRNVRFVNVAPSNPPVAIAQTIIAQ